MQHVGDGDVESGEPGQVKGRLVVAAEPGTREPDEVVELVLDQESALDPKKHLRDGLSAVVSVDDVLWLANDETTSLEQLTRTGPGRYAEQQTFDLSSLLGLGDEASGEIDIEGLAVDETRIWLLGSHSTVRGRVKKNDSDREAIESLASIEPSPGRRVLARIPFDRLLDADGDHDGGSAAVERLDLVELLVDDRHLSPFLRQGSGDEEHLVIPGKDNGLDMEGLAVRGSRVFVGLRGPVLRGWAVVLELDIADGTSLQPRPLTDDGQVYRKHFVDLGGLGIRDLSFDGEDLLVLAGPTMELDGRIAVYRWKRVPEGAGDTLTRSDGLDLVLNVRFGRGTDRAEGMTIVEGKGDKRLLVVYDVPAPSRKIGDHTVLADLFEIHA